MKKIIFFTIAALACFIMSQNAYAQHSMHIDVSEKQVGINTGFTGASFSVFGTTAHAGDIAIAIYGPPKDTTVRHKGQFLGMWMNKDSLSFYNVPAYYDIALSIPASQISDYETLLDNYIGLDSLEFRYRGRKSNEDKAARFREALIHNKQLAGHYPLAPRNIEFITEKFFRADFHVPSDVPTGRYSIKGFIFEDGVLTAQSAVSFDVAQVGLSARVFRFAYADSFIYSLLAIFMALIAGAGAHYTLRRD